MKKIINSDGRCMLGRCEARDLGIWVLKTWLLLAHPGARLHREGRQRPLSGSWDVTDITADLYGWMVTGQPPPDGLSVWVSRLDQSAEPCSTPLRIWLPTVVADGLRTSCRVRQFAIRSLEVTLVYHPGWLFAHPLAVQSRALQVWPPLEQDLDLGALPPTNPREVVWTGGPTIHFEAGVWGRIDPPTLRPSPDPFVREFDQLDGVICIEAPALSPVSAR